MFSINHKQLKNDMKDKGIVIIPYYAGKCPSCRHLNGSECKKKFIKIIRAYVNRKIHDRVCVNWEFNLKYFTSMTRRTKDGKVSKSGDSKN